jgi:hypothetical protein
LAAENKMKKQNNWIAFCLILILFLAIDVAAQEECVECAAEYVELQKPNLTVSKTAPSSAYLGDIVEIIIEIKNNENKEINLYVKEILPENLEIIEPEPQIEHWEHLEVSYIDWNISIPAGSSKSVSYKIRPTRNGILQIASTQVFIENGKGVASNVLAMFVFCRPDGFCNTREGENNKWCPDDCDTGIEDRSCDMKEDGICDPDCIPEADPDCEPEEVEEEKKSRTGLIIGIIILIIIIILVAIIIIKKISKKKEETNNIYEYQQ